MVKIKVKGESQEKEEEIKMKVERKFKGVKAAVGEMPRYKRNNGLYLEVHYDLEEDEVLTNLHCSFGHNSWTQYHDSSIIFVGFYDERISMAELKADIRRAIANHRASA